MMISKMLNFKRPSICAFVFCFLMLTVIDGAAQKRQAFVIVRPSNTTVSEASCSGSLELNYYLVDDLKLNNKENVVLLNGVSSEDTAVQVSRQMYENSGDSKLKNLYSLFWNEKGVLLAVSSAGQTPFVVVPDNLKPQKNTQTGLSSFYSVTLTGEARDGKSKRKLNLGLREIWKIYFIPEGSNLNDTLFTHATDEKSVAVWEAFLRKTNNYRNGEANSLMRESLLTCSQKNLEAFRNGKYVAAEEARRQAERAQGVRGDETSRQLLETIAREQQKVDQTRAQVEQLLRQNRFDDAITTAEPIKIYIDSWTDLNKLYTDALKQSHDLHLDKGEKALMSNQLEIASSECETALKRQPVSAAARACVCQSRTRVVLRDSDNLLKQKKPKAAKDLLEKQLSDSDCTRDVNIADKLIVAKCEYGKQLLLEARQTIGGSGGTVAAPPSVKGRRGKVAPAGAAKSGGVKVVTAVNKTAFRDARSKLIESQALCDSEEVRNLLESANQKLADYSFDRAAAALRSGNYGTAYVYLQSAQKYTPNDIRVIELLDRARNEFNEKIRVNIGVVFDNKSGVNTGDRALEQVRGAIESITADVGLSQPNILEPRDARNALNQIRNQTSPTAVFTFNLLGFSFRKDEDRRNVRSSYSYTNPQWKNADLQHDSTKKNWERCKKSSGEAACTNLRADVDRLRTYRDGIRKTLTENYYYRENLIRINGNVRMVFLYNDSITGSVRSSDTLDSAVNKECVEREGVHPEDNSTRDQFCNVADGSVFLEAMIGDIRNQAISVAATQLRSMPLGYYRLAKTSSDKNASAEKYIRYLFLTDLKDSTEAQEARRALLAIDPELETDGELR